MRSRPSTRIATVLALLLGAALAGGGAAQGHEERESEFPDGSGTVPSFRSIDEAEDVVVVCKPDSQRRIGREISDPQVRAFNARLLGQCEFEHIQAAVDHVREDGVAGTNIYVLPGLYLEEPSREAPCNEEHEGGVVEYEDLFACPTMTQLVGIMGDDPDDEDHKCDNSLCRLQLEGTGDDPEDVIIQGGFKDDGDWIDQHNGIKADRADGIYIRNLTTELFRENSIYVHETDGYALDGTVTRKNDLYGILTFAADHGLIKDCLAHHNGDGGIYPGSPSDLYADEDFTGELPRPAVEITGCEAHHNALGHSATAGNAIYLHDNDFHHNAAGIVVDSFVPDHPGHPVDHNWFEDNRVFANNFNPYQEFLYTGVCDKPPAERGYENGTVCPAFPLPVGTGILIAGGNHNLVRGNDIWDNWRNGVMQFWVPAAVREEPDPSKQFDTSNFNHYLDNTMGLSPAGLTQPNGTDFWWDDQGEGNCWQGNTSAGTENGSPTHNSTDPRGLPDCDSGGSSFVISNPVKSVGLAPCATYDREDNPRPPGCDWFETPPEPEGREGGGDGEENLQAAGPAQSPGASSSVAGLPATGGGLLLGLIGIGLLGTAARLRRQR